MNIEINDNLIKEFEYIIKLHKESGKPFLFDSVEGLINSVLFSIADGSRRPGSWERGIVQQLGLIADHDEHYEYRGSYGKTDD